MLDTQIAECLHRLKSRVDRINVRRRCDDHVIASMGERLQVVQPRSGLGINDHVLVVAGQPGAKPLVSDRERERTAFGPPCDVAVIVPVEQQRGRVVGQVVGQMYGCLSL